jgi:nicotinamide mononucleotide adenylyltransferase
MKNKKYALYVGRWQVWHSGHRWLIDQKLNQGIPVCIAVRDVATDEKNPYTAQQVRLNLMKELYELIRDGLVDVIVIPDIESFNYGRDVGYEVIEHVPPTEIAEISGTKIRAQMANENHTI